MDWRSLKISQTRQHIITAMRPHIIAEVYYRP